MTPAARVQAAIECLDRIVAGDAAERTLTRWARSSRYAGSKDRAAVRDLVFGVLRQYWSSAARGRGETGRARMIGYLAASGTNPVSLFTGQGHAPAPLEHGEAAGDTELEPLIALDCPPEFAAVLQTSLGPDFAPVLEALRHRAEVHLRVNIARTTRDRAQQILAADGIATEPHLLSPTALTVIDNARAVARSDAYTTGLIELQDASSQALTDCLPLDRAKRVLDFCAGGGGKTLAMAARHSATYHAHDAAPDRLTPLVARAHRAGADVALRNIDDLRSEPPYDLVLVDAPCSGSGAWRRSPEGKIRLTPLKLEKLQTLQRQILVEAAQLVGSGGCLAYATCSLLESENGEQVDRFLETYPRFRDISRHLWTPIDGGDGFFLAILANEGRA